MTQETIITDKFGFTALILTMLTSTSGYVELKEYFAFPNETIKVWNFGEKANIFRFWAPYDAAGAILAGMTAFEQRIQKREEERTNQQIIAQTAKEIAAQFKEVYQLTKANDY